MDEREAFCQALVLFADGDWSPALPDARRLPVRDKSYTFDQLCELVSDMDDEMPDPFIGLLTGEAIKLCWKSLEEIEPTRWPAPVSVR
jgi:hypothetical protein